MSTMLTNVLGLKMTERIVIYLVEVGCWNVGMEVEGSGIGT